MIRQIAFSVFRSTLQSQTLFDYKCPITQDASVFHDTTLIYGQKYHEQSRRKRIKAVTKRQAINGIMPNYDYQMLFSLKAKKSRDRTQFELNSQIPLPDLRQSNIANKMPYICLNHHGRQNELPSYEIVKGDIIKLGNALFEVVQTHLNKNKERQLQSLQIKNAFQSHEIIDNVPRKACRICLMESDQNNDLISPCYCKGSCQYVHFSCLQDWISSKVKKQENRLVETLFLQKMECQICKKPLNNKIQVNNKTKSLLNFKYTNSPYIVIESLNQKGSKYFYILKPDGKNIKIGRDLGTDIRLKDSNVSPIHCSISYRNNRFYLNDQGSKFGSLILLKKEVIIDKIMCIQIGPKVLKFEQFSIRLSNE